MNNICCTNQLVKGAALPKKSIREAMQSTINQSLRKLADAESGFANESFLDAVSAWSSLRDKGLIYKLSQFAKPEHKSSFRPVQYDLVQMILNHVEELLKQDPNICRVKLIINLLESLDIAITQPCWNQ